MGVFSSSAENFNKGMLEVFLSTWQTWAWIIVYIFVLFIIKIAVEVWIPNYIKRKRVEKKMNQVNKWSSDRDLIGNLKKLHPNDFENYIADLYLRLGYKTEKVGGSYDGGVDVVATKDGVKHYIQCKKYITSKVSVGNVRDFAGALMDKLSQGRGIFITTNIFTTEAEKFAEDKPIELIDGDDLLKLIKLANKENEVSISNTHSANEIRKCPKCGGNLIERAGKYGKFLGCSNYPKCTNTEKIQTVSNL